MAGLILKNNIRQYFLSLRPQEMQERLQIIRAEVIKTISDDSHLIRVTGSIVITTIASRIGLSTWPELFPALYQMLGKFSYLNGSSDLTFWYNKYEKLDQILSVND